MFGTLSLNRVFQFFYPTLVFFTFLLTWNTIGQVKGFADPHLTPHFNWERPSRDPASAPLSCSEKRLSFPDVQSCKVDITQPRKLIDTDDAIQNSVKQLALSRPKTAQPGPAQAGAGAL
jgi:hypothetical protein